MNQNSTDLKTQRPVYDTQPWCCECGSEDLIWLNDDSYRCKCCSYEFNWHYARKQV